MDLTCLHHCGPSPADIVALLTGAVFAMLIARRARWTMLLTAPLLYVALVIFAGEGYTMTPPWWLTVSVIGILLLGVIGWPRVRRRRSKRSA
jgi:hypothetical protein